MFTGIIQATGTIEKIDQRHKVTILTFSCPQLAPYFQNGSSVSVDGTCLTVVHHDKENFTVEAIPETLQKSIAQFYQKGDIVNLETPLTLDQGLDGHLVTGHVDFRTKILAKNFEKNTAVLDIELPASMARYIAMKGSITVNGVSLTVSKLQDRSFEVSIIPHTLRVTNLGKLEKGSMVNVEVDLVARYLERLLNEKDKEITRDFLKERGFI